MPRASLIYMMIDAERTSSQNKTTNTLIFD
jgi:hypothetical protein